MTIVISTFKRFDNKRKLNANNKLRKSLLLQFLNIFEA